MAKSSWEDRWVVTGELSRGGQGTTSLVRAITGDQVAVLKVLRNQKSEQARRRMYQEVSNLKVLHAAACPVPEVFDDNTSSFEDVGVKLYFVMEYIKAPTLRKLVEDRDGLPIERSIAIAEHLLDAVEKATSNQVLHRDLKPENILVPDSETGSVCVVDYGLSFNTSIAEDITKIDETLDNDFLSLPEKRVPGGNRRDERSDITCVAGIFLYCLTNVPPIDLRDDQNKAPHKRSGVDLRKIASSPTQAMVLEALFDKAFSPAADYRFQTCKELRYRLESVRNGVLIHEDVDPVEFAKQSAIRLLEMDRISRLQAMTEKCQMILDPLRKYVSDNNNRFSPYSIDILRSAPQKIKPPLGCEILQCQSIRVRARHPYHKPQLAHLYAVGIKDQECRILKCQCGFDQPSKNRLDEPIQGEWVELAWFDGMSPPAELGELLFQDAQATIMKMMKEIEDYILGN